MKSLGKVSKNERGFEFVKFNDLYNAECSLQMSSLAHYEKPGTSAVWLGVDDPDPKILASEAASHGIKSIETTGWVTYPIPDNVVLSTRCHLDRDQVEALIKHLQKWLEDDTFKIKNYP